jgi:cell division septum initiation protein DivIVA
MLGRARAEADRLISEAHQERRRLVSDSELVDEAERVAAEIRRDAEAEAIRMRDQTDDYIDASLARFEQLLSASLETVMHGRARVAASRGHADTEGQHYADEYGDEQYAGGEQLTWTAGDPDDDQAADPGGIEGQQPERPATTPASTG